VQECAQTSFFAVNSSGIAIFGMRTVQADSCLNSEQIDTLFISVGGQEGGLGGGGDILGRRPKIYTCMSENKIEPSCLQSPKGSSVPADSFSFYGMCQKYLHS